jgi:hypothetical protein
VLIDDAATGEAIRSDFLSLASDVVAPDDRILVFFAGHGVTRTGRRGEVGYLVPVDGDTSKLSTMIRWDDLTRNGELISAKHVLFIMDACYGGLAITRGIQPGSTRFLKDMLQRYSRQVLTAGKANEVVSDVGGPKAGHSVFTGHLLEALEGKAASASGIISASAVMAYVYDKVATDPHSIQTPHYGYLEGDGDFLFSAPQVVELSKEEQKDLDVLIQVPANLGPTDMDQPSLADNVKEFISDPTKRIRLDDLVTRQLRAAIASLTPGYPTDKPPPDAASLAERLQGYQQAAADLSIVAILLARWGTEQHSSLLTRVLSRLADLNDSVGGYNAWVGLRWYPLCQLLYYSGIAALSSENYETLGALFRARARSAQGDEPTKLVFAHANAGVADAHEVFKLLPGHEKQYVPRSELMYKNLQPLLDDLIFLGGGYEELFDRFEVINALAHANQRADTHNPWGPPGRFLWKAQRGGGGPLGEIEKEAKAAGAAWPVLKTGLFGGSSERFLEIVRVYRERMKGIVW